jgi:dienelactone hydrolase
MPAFDEALCESKRRNEGRKFMSARFPALLATALVVAIGTVGRADDIAEERVSLTLEGTAVRLDAVLVRQANAQGRLPIAVINPGTVTGVPGPGNTPALHVRLARDFAYRGWLAAVVIGRGAAQTDTGKPVTLACSAADIAGWTASAADDLQAMIGFIGRRPDADAGRVLVIGALSGGVAAVALSARNPSGLAAVVSVSGGLKPDPQCVMDDVLADMFAEFGKRSRVPNLWIYSRDDKAFPPALTERIHASFLDGGGNVKFVQFHVETNAGNAIFTAARRQWMTQIDGFLQALKLPTWTMADVDQIVSKLKIKDVIKGLTVTNLANYYFPAPGEKAFAHSYAAAAAGTATGSSPASSFPWSYTVAAASLDAARKSALDACAKRTNAQCTIVLENNSWVDKTNP